MDVLLLASDVMRLDGMEVMVGSEEGTEVVEGRGLPSVEETADVGKEEVSMVDTSTVDEEEGRGEVTLSVTPVCSVAGVVALVDVLLLASDVMRLDGMEVMVGSEEGTEVVEGGGLPSVEETAEVWKEAVSIVDTSAVNEEEGRGEVTLSVTPVCSVAAVVALVDAMLLASDVMRLDGMEVMVGSEEGTEVVEGRGVPSVEETADVGNEEVSRVDTSAVDEEEGRGEVTLSVTPVCSVAGVVALVDVLLLTSDVMRLDGMEVMVGSEEGTEVVEDGGVSSVEETAEVWKEAVSIVDTSAVDEEEGRGEVTLSVTPVCSVAGVLALLDVLLLASDVMRLDGMEVMVGSEEGTEVVEGGGLPSVEETAEVGKEEVSMVDTSAVDEEEGRGEVTLSVTPVCSVEGVIALLDVLLLTSDVMRLDGMEVMVGSEEGTEFVEGREVPSVEETADVGKEAVSMVDTSTVDEEEGRGEVTLTVTPVCSVAGVVALVDAMLLASDVMRLDGIVVVMGSEEGTEVVEGGGLPSVEETAEVVKEAVSIVDTSAVDEEEGRGEVTLSVTPVCSVAGVVALLDVLLLTSDVMRLDGMEVMVGSEEGTEVMEGGGLPSVEETADVGKEAVSMVDTSIVDEEEGRGEVTLSVTPVCSVVGVVALLDVLLLASDVMRLDGMEVMMGSEEGTEVVDGGGLPSVEETAEVGKEEVSMVDTSAVDEEEGRGEVTLSVTPVCSVAGVVALLDVLLLTSDVMRLDGMEVMVGSEEGTEFVEGREVPSVEEAADVENEEDSIVDTSAVDEEEGRGEVTLSVTPVCSVAGVVALVDVLLLASDVMRLDGMEVMVGSEEGTEFVEGRGVPSVEETADVGKEEVSMVDTSTVDEEEGRGEVTLTVTPVCSVAGVVALVDAMLLASDVMRLDGIVVVMGSEEGTEVVEGGGLPSVEETAEVVKEAVSIVDTSAVDEEEGRGEVTLSVTPVCSVAGVVALLDVLLLTSDVMRLDGMEVMVGSEEGTEVMEGGGLPSVEETADVGKEAVSMVDTSIVDEEEGRGEVTLSVTPVCSVVGVVALLDVLLLASDVMRLDGMEVMMGSEEGTEVVDGGGLPSVEETAEVGKEEVSMVDTSAVDEEEGRGEVTLSVTPVCSVAGVVVLLDVLLLTSDVMRLDGMEVMVGSEEGTEFVEGREVPSVEEAADVENEEDSIVDTSAVDEEEGRGEVTLSVTPVCSVAGVVALVDVLLLASDVMRLDGMEVMVGSEEGTEFVEGREVPSVEEAADVENEEDSIVDTSAVDEEEGRGEVTLSVTPVCSVAGVVALEDVLLLASDVMRLDGMEVMVGSEEGTEFVEGREVPSVEETADVGNEEASIVDTSAVDEEEGRGEVTLSVTPVCSVAGVVALLDVLLLASDVMRLDGMEVIVGSEEGTEVVEGRGVPSVEETADVGNEEVSKVDTSAVDEEEGRGEVTLSVTLVCSVVGVVALVDVRLLASDVMRLDGMEVMMGSEEGTEVVESGGLPSVEETADVGKEAVSMVDTSTVDEEEGRGEVTLSVTPVFSVAGVVALVDAMLLASDVMRLGGIVVVMGSEEGTEVVEGGGLPSVEETAEVVKEAVSIVDTSAVDEEEGRGEVTLSVTPVSSVAGVVALEDVLLLTSDVMRLDGMEVMVGSEEGTEFVEGREVPSVEETADVGKEAVSMVDTSTVDEEEGRGEVTLSVTPVFSVAGVVALVDAMLLASDVMRLDGIVVVMGSEEGTEVVEGGGLPSVEETAEVVKEAVSIVDTSAVDEEEGRGEVTLSVTPVSSVAGVVALEDVLLLTSDVMRLDGMEVMVGSEEGTEFVEGREVPSVEETADVGKEAVSMVDTSTVDEEEGRGEVTLSVTPVFSVAGVVALVDAMLLASDVMRLDGIVVVMGSEEGTEVVEGGGLPSVEETAEVVKEAVSIVDTSAVDEEEGRGEVTLSVTPVCSVAGVVALLDVLLLTSDVMRLDGMEVMVGSEEGTEVVEGGGLPSVEETADIGKEAVSMVDTSTVDEEEGRGEVTLSVTPVCSLAGVVALLDVLLLASDVMRLDGMEVMVRSEEGTEVVEGRGVPSVEETADVGNEEVSKVDTSAVDEEEGTGEVTLSVTLVCSVVGVVALEDVLLLTSDVMRLDGMEVMVGSEKGTEFVEGRELPSVEETADVGNEKVSMVDTSAVDEEEGRGEVTLSVMPVCSVAGVVALLDVLLLTSDVMRLDGMEVMVGSEEGTEVVESGGLPSVEETAEVGKEAVSMVDTSAVDEEEGRGEVTLSVTPMCSVVGVVALLDVLLLASDVMRLDGMEVMMGSEEGTEVVEGGGLPSVEETAEVGKEEVSMVDTSAVDEEEGRGEVTLSVTPVCSVAGVIALLDVLLLTSDVMRLDGMEVMVGSEEGTEFVEGREVPSVEETGDVGNEEASIVDTSAVDEEEGRGEVTLSVTPVCSVAGVLALLDVLLLASDVMRLDGMEVMVGSEEGTEVVEGRGVPSVEETADVGNEEVSKVDTSAVDEEEGRGEVTLSVTLVCSVVGVVALVDVLLLASDVMRLDGMEVMVGSEEGTEVIESGGLPSVEETADVVKEAVSMVDTSTVDEEEGRGEVTLSVTPVFSVAGVVALVDAMLLASDVMRLDGIVVVMGSEEGTEVVEGGGLPSVEETAEVGKEEVSMVDTSAVDEEEGRGEVTLSVTPVCSVAGVIALLDVLLLASDVMRLDGMEVMVGSEEGTEVVEGRGVPSVEETGDVGNEEASIVDTSAVDEEEGRGEVTLSVTPVCSVAGVLALLDVLLLASDVMRLDGMEVMVGSEEGTEVVEGRGVPSVEETADVGNEEVSKVDTSAVDEEEGRGEVTLSVTLVCSVVGVVALVDVLLLASDVMRLDGMEVMVGSEEGTEVIESGGLPSVEETADVVKEAVSMVDTSTVDEEEGRGEVTLSVTPVFSVAGVVALVDAMLLASDVMRLDGIVVVMGSEEGTEVVEGGGLPSVEEAAEVVKEAVSIVDTSAVDEEEGRGEVTLSVTPVCSVAGVVALEDVLLLTSDVMRLDGMEVMVGSEEGTEVVEGGGLPSVEKTADVGKEAVSMVDTSTVDEEEGRGEVTLSVTPVCSVAGVVALLDVLVLASDVMRLDGMEVIVGSGVGTELVEGRGVPSVEETGDVGNEEVSMVDTSAVDEEEGRGEVTLSVTWVCSVGGVVALLDVLLLASDVMRLDGMEVMVASEEGTEVVEGRGVPSVEETADVGNEEVSKVDTSAVDEEEGTGEVTLSVTLVCSVVGVVALEDVLLLTSDVMRLDGMEVMVGSEEGTEFVEGRELPSVEETADVGNEKVSMVDASAVDEEEGRGEVTLSVMPVCSVAGVVALLDVLLLTSDVMRLDGMEVMVGSEEGTEVVESGGLPSVEETAEVGKEVVSMVDTSAVDEEEGRDEVTLSVTLVCSVAGVVALLDVLVLASDVMRLDGMEVIVGSGVGTELVEGRGVPSVEETGDVGNEEVSMVDTSAVDEEEGRGEVTLSVTPVCSVGGVVALLDVLLLASDVMRLDGMEVMVASEEGTEVVEGRGVPSVEETADVGNEEVSKVDTSAVDEEEGTGEVTLSVTLVCSVVGVVVLEDVLLLTSDVMRLDGMEVMVGSEEGTEFVEGRELPSVEETADAGNEKVSMVDASAVDEEEGRGEVTLSVMPVCSVAGVVALLDVQLLTSDVMRLDGMEVMVGSEEGTEVVESGGLPSVEETAEVGKEALSMVDTSAVDEEEGRGEVTLSVTLVCSVAGVVALLDVLLLTSGVVRLDGMEVMMGSEEGTEVVEGRGLPSVEETADVGKEEVSMVDISTVNEEEGRGEVTLSFTLECSVAGVVALVDAMLLASDVMRLDGMEVMVGSEEGTEFVEGREVPSVEETADVGNEEASIVDTSAVDEEEGRGEVTLSVTPVCSVAGVLALLDVLLLASDVMRLDGMEVMVGSEEGTEVVEGGGLPSVEETADVGNEEVSKVDTSAVDEEEGTGEVTLSVTLVCSVVGVVALMDVLLLASDVMRLDGMEVMVGSEEGTEVVESGGLPSVEETADVGNEKVSMVDASAVDEEEGRGEVTLSVTLVCSAAGVVALLDVLLLTSGVVRLDGMEVMMGSEEGTEVVEGRGLPSVEETAEVGKEEVSMVDISTVNEEEGRGEVTLSVTLVCSVAGVVALVDAMLLASDVMRLDGMEVMMGSEEGTEVMEGGELPSVEETADVGKEAVSMVDTSAVDEKLDGMEVMMGSEEETEVVEGGGLPSVEETADVGKEEVSMVDTSAVDEEEGRGEVTLSVTPVCSVAGVVALLDVLLLTSDVMRLDGMEVMVGSEEGTEFVEGREVPSVEETADVGNEEASIVDTSAVDEEEGRGEVTLSVTTVCSVAGVVALLDVLLLASDVMRLDGMEVMVGSEEGTEVVEGRGVPSV
ncbi:UNVERIFIED_CONTAM: hypothetical protein K2H54_040437 [Gekko kuhli]